MPEYISTVALLPCVTPSFDKTLKAFNIWSDWAVVAFLCLIGL